MYRLSFIVFVLLLFHLIHARVLPGEAQLIRLPNDLSSHVERRGLAERASGCVNSPANRNCWNNKYDVNTDIEASWPNTGNFVKYNLEIQNLTLAPDGVSRPVYAINGQYPGPTIRANWGDTIQVTVKNSLQTNGTSIHWHGVRQWRSNPMDGTNGITECPMAPGQSRTYNFLATQYGTSWYHSHHASQYTDGVVGSIIIDGPATANYDVDLGVLPITDWFYQTASNLFTQISSGAIRGTPVADNILINGTNVNSEGGGKYHRNIIQKNKIYRLRLVNTGANNGVKVGLDKHSMTVIAMDFVAITPYSTDWLYIGVGQRYDVLIRADQPIDSYWFHVVPQTACSNNRVRNALSIFRYRGAKNRIPSDATRNNVPPTDDCNDPNSDLKPWVSHTVPSNQKIPASNELSVGVNIVRNRPGQTSTQSTVQWLLNFTAIQAPWEKPTLEYVRDQNTKYPSNMNLIKLPETNTWTFWVVQSQSGGPAPPQPHPIHLHGHDFFVLASGTGNFDSSTPLVFNNPPKRDVAMLPSAGYLVLAFVTDNPGAWLMHCHIPWHASLGFGAQFLEGASQIPHLLSQTSGWDQQCSSWNNYHAKAPFPEEGSGL